MNAQTARREKRIVLDGKSVTVLSLPPVRIEQMRRGAGGEAPPMDTAVLASLINDDRPHR